MKRTCSIAARCSLGNKILASKLWTGVDIMRTGYTRGWCTRQLRLHPQDHVVVFWECVHDKPVNEGDGPYCHHFKGSIVRIQGSLLRRGIFE